jgi:hypothetical protein
MTNEEKIERAKSVIQNILDNLANAENLPKREQLEFKIVTVQAILGALNNVLGS